MLTKKREIRTETIVILTKEREIRMETIVIFKTRW